MLENAINEFKEIYSLFPLIKSLEVTREGNVIIYFPEGDFKTCETAIEILEYLENRYPKN